MPIFSSYHKKTVCLHLNIEIDDFEEAAKIAHRNALTQKQDLMKWRTLSSYLVDQKRLTTSKSTEAVIAVLCEMGIIGANEKWLSTSGQSLPDKGSSIPQTVVPSIELEEAEQRSIGDAHTGLLHVYRCHGSNKEWIVRELLYIKGGNGLIQEVWYMNHRGAVYKGHAYRKFTILYLYLFRKHDRFKFASRTIMLSIEATGAILASSGVMIRIRKTGALPISSDVICVPVELQKTNIVDLMVAAHEGEHPLDQSTVDSDFRTTEQTNLDHLDTPMKAMVSRLRYPVAGVSQEEVWKTLKNPEPQAV